MILRGWKAGKVAFLGIKRGAMNEHQQLIEEIEKNGTGSGGKTALLKYLRGETIHRSAAVKAKCFECCGYYADGRVDCGITTCPLYLYMPYRGKVATEDVMDSEEVDESEGAEQVV